MAISKLVRMARMIKATFTRSIKARDGSTYRFQPLLIQRLAVEASRGTYEPEILELIRQTLASRHGLFVDVGANTGQTLLALLSVDPECSYLGIEPQVEACAEVVRLITQNDLDRHAVLPIALSDTTGFAELSFGYESDVRASIVGDFRPASALPLKRVVPTMTGDDLISSRKEEQIAFIKVDVEGAEYEVLSGFRKTIAEHQPVLTFEVLPDLLVADGTALPDQIIQARRRRWDRLAQLLDELDYHAFLFDGSVATLVAVGPDPDGSVRNYAACPRTGPMPPYRSHGLDAPSSPH